VQQTLTPLAFLLLLIAVLGSLVLFLVARTVSNPIRQLAQQADLISMGQMDTPIAVKGTGEIWELASAFRRMQTSIKYMMEQMDNQQS
jgi:nitrogen fixation/metabolism regulation signal transduction histidine kinase